MTLRSVEPGEGCAEAAYWVTSAARGGARRPGADHPDQVGPGSRAAPVSAATPDGRNLIGEIMPLRRQREDELVASLDGAELATVLAAIGKLIAWVAPRPPGQRALSALAARKA